MKSKKRRVLIICAVTLVAAIALAVCSPFIAQGFDRLCARSYIENDIKNVDNILLVAECAEVDGQAQSIAGVKEAVRLGADAVKVDLCFRTDGTPVITDNYENNAEADTVERLFIEMNDEKYKDVGIYLNIIQLSQLTELNRLAVEYNMVGRTYLIGIDESHYGLVTNDSTIVPFLLKYKFTRDDLQKIEEGKFSAPECIAKYGAGGLEIDVADATEQIITALNDFGIPFIVSGIDSVKDFCTALLGGSGTICLDDVEKYSQILDAWIQAMQERNKFN